MADSYDVRLAKDLSQFYDDPLGYVMYAFPWGTEPSIQMVELDERYRGRFDSEYGPDVWACEFLDQLGEEIRARKFDGKNAVRPIKFSTTSGHGIGKSTLAAWLSKFIMDTRPRSKGTMTANTAEQLKTKTWAEVGKWHNLSLTKHWFRYSATRGSMSLVHNILKSEWRLDAQTCREENSEAFAGQHAPTATSFYIFDEAGGIPKKIFEVREGGTTDGEPMVFDFGNPTRNSGQFYENCAGDSKHRFITRTIDSRDVKLTNKERIAEWAEDYGEESDFFKIRVRGMFPSAGSLQFIKNTDVEAAMRRPAFKEDFPALIIGVDVARFGDDDSIIFTRMGMDCRSFPYKSFSGLNTVQLTGQVIETIRHFKATLGVECSGLFVDGGGVGGGVVDQLQHLGYSPIEVQFGGSPIDSKTYRFRSDEMWGRMREAIGSRLLLPEDKNLQAQLTQREFGYTLVGNKIHLETKKEMKERGIGSPDIADALALTFAMDVAPKMLNHGDKQVILTDYDPFTLRF